MDPNLFHLDWDRSLEVLATVVLLSLVVERALALLFESAWYIERISKQNRHLKEPIALALAYALCLVWDFDAVSMLILADETNWFGALVTAGVVAGGSKGSVTLFREWLGFKSTARKQYEASRPTPPAAAPGSP